MRGIVLLLVLYLVQAVSCAKILALMVVPSHSHHFWNSKYLEALVERGHHVTYFGVDEYKNPPKNVTYIRVENMYEVIHESDFTEFSDAGPYQSTILLEEWDELTAKVTAESEALKVLNGIIRKEKFDLVVYDVAMRLFVLGAVDVLGRPPVIGITAYGIPTWTLDVLGNPMSYSSKPYFYTQYKDVMSFIQRANNYFLHLFSFAVQWVFLRKQNDLVKKCFGKDVRPLEQILDDINIVLGNSNPGVDYPFPKVPGLVPVGGLHIQEPKPLPQDLQNFLDKAKEGVVYFSLGSNILSSKLRREEIDILMKAFEKLSPVQVLWKYEADYGSEQPKNVKMAKWLPQNDLLAHPNVRVFFTHSGMLSTQEAIYHGKPVVAMPILLDQHVNAKKCVERGLGEIVSFRSLSVEKIVGTIRKVLEDPRYSKNAKKASVIFRDELEHPLVRAVYWTEYAIRHKGAPHLRHSARNLSWVQNWMLDVILLTITSVFIALFLANKLIVRLICSGEKTKVKKS